MARIFWKHDPEVAACLRQWSQETGKPLPYPAPFIAAIEAAGGAVDLETGEIEWPSTPGPDAVIIRGYTATQTHLTRREARPTDTASAE
ncbi:MAG TPA: hypothetical protein ENJ31_09410 [Anaerolineae bacterium]|nr:hypothetical protein [Anaerolineae bacterium]